MEARKELTFGLLGQGNTVNEAIKDFYITLEDMKNLYQDTGQEFPENLEFVFQYDVASFLAYYSNVLSLVPISEHAHPLSPQETDKNSVSKG